jgi:hypothetical protein
MANFICVCNSCERKLSAQVKTQKREWTKEEYESLVLFETSHSIKATEAEIKEALTCPRCDGQDCSKTFIGYDVMGYVRGNGYLDTAGCKRDMNLFHLTQDDPYADYRVPGEVEEMKTQLKKAGQHNPRKKHFDVTGAAKKGMQNAVEKAVSSPAVEAPKPSIPSVLLCP